MRRLVLLFLMLAAVQGIARAQGGPPMITDDPGTPGDRHWEINLAWTDQHAGGETLYGLPLLDANYGVGDRIQLNYQASWNVSHAADAGDEQGLSASQLAVKWRFYDAGESGLQVSTYPRVIFPDPHPDPSDRSGPDTRTSYFLPIEIARDFGSFALNVDFGHTFSPLHAGRGWSGGLCLGHTVTKGWEVDAELHINSSEDLGQSEVIANLGTRVDLGEHTTLILAVGRDLSNGLADKVTLLSYVGIQFRL
jgi:hypothetical protein